MSEQYGSLAEVCQYIDSRAWAVAPGTFRAVEMMGAPVPIAAQSQGRQTTAGVAVIPVRGVLTQRPIGGLFGMLFGGGSYEQIGAMAIEADNMADVDRIVLDFDTPGGEVMGIEPLTQVLSEIRKPKIGIANSVAASAGYWILSQMDEVVVSPGGKVGSIGVIAVHTDYSKAMEEIGITETVIGEPDGKLDEWSQTLTDATKGHAEGQLREYYARFISTVAKGRGVSPETVRSKFGQGRMVLDTAAQSAGMVDRVASMRDTLARASNSRSRVKSRARAQATRAWLDAKY